MSLKWRGNTGKRQRRRRGRGVAWEKDGSGVQFCGGGGFEGGMERNGFGGRDRKFCQLFSPDSYYSDDLIKYCIDHVYSSLHLYWY